MRLFDFILGRLNLCARDDNGKSALFVCSVFKQQLSGLCRAVPCGWQD